VELDQGVAAADRVGAAWPMVRAALSERYRNRWFQIAWCPFLGIGKGMPLMAPVTPLPLPVSLAVLAISMVLS
jgi:hypothetical protein